MPTLQEYGEYLDKYREIDTYWNVFLNESRQVEGKLKFINTRIQAFMLDLSERSRGCVQCTLSSA